jgi:hypothetical protein
MATAKPVVNAAALDKTINASVEAIANATSAANAAVTSKSAEYKKLLTEVKRHTKKRGVLTKRGKAAETKNKKTPNAANMKAVADISKQLKETLVVQENARASKSAVIAELSLLKASQKRLNAYSRAISSADKVLNKPIKKRRIVKKTK